ncbi:MAG TPA: lipid-A-disaccharide synthase N-terminal domain-containing protein [Acidobacteriota bacterium]|nr:lipid-A-disaccharide synthase N-terminal domain-containing protein [Acidobacteriota bacterium]
MESVLQYFHDLYVQMKDPWALVGWAGQVVFSCRFVVQWVVSERQKKSVIPISFWYLSIIGSLLLLAYGFYVKQPVYIAGYLFNSAVYLRNLSLIRQGNIKSELAMRS